MEMKACLFFSAFAVLFKLTYAGILQLDIFHPDSLMNQTHIRVSGLVYQINVYSCMENHFVDNAYTFGSPSCPGGEFFAAGDKAAMFTVTSAMKAGPNHYRAKVDMGTQYTGIFFVTILSASIVGSSSVLICDPPYLEPACFSIGVPWSGVISDPKQGYNLTMYPAFGMNVQKGEVSTLFKNYPSTFGLNTNSERDIYLYKPPTVVSNNIRRKMNVLVVNDGNQRYLESYVYNGFEVAQNNGIVPESIMIGVPQDGTSCERAYELTYEQCDNKFQKYDRNEPGKKDYWFACPNASGGNQKCEVTGGNDFYLTWVYTVLLPDVMQNLGMILGEVSIIGGSFGGLTACYAPSRFPQWFSRGLCYAPTTSWNFGSISNAIKDNFEKNLGQLPKAVIMQQGHEAYDLFYSDVTGETKNLLQLTKDTFDAYVKVGMTPYSLDDMDVELPAGGWNSYDATVFGKAPPHMVMFFNHRQAFHLVQEWQLSFLQHLTALYRPSFNDSTKLQSVDYSWYIGQESANSDSTDDDSLKTGLIAGLIVCGSLLMFSLAYIFHLRNGLLKSGSDKQTELGAASTANPLGHARE